MTRPLPQSRPVMNKLAYQTEPEDPDKNRLGYKAGYYDGSRLIPQKNFQNPEIQQLYNKGYNQGIVDFVASNQNRLLKESHK